MIGPQLRAINRKYRTILALTLYLLPLGPTSGHPSQGHGSPPAALNQMPRCTTDHRASIVFSFSPDFDAELRIRSRAGASLNVCDAAPAPVAHIDQPRAASVSMVWPCASAKTGHPQESNQKPHDRADSPHCLCRHGATEHRAPCACICGQVLRACQPVLLPLKHLVHRPSSSSKHCDMRRSLVGSV